MAISYHPSLFSEVLAHIDIEYHMASYLLIPRRDLITFKFFERNPNVLNLFTNRVPPQCVPVLFVESFSLGKRLGHTNTKLVGAHPILGIDLQDDPFSLLDNKRDPPCKRGFWGYSRSDRIICQLHWERVLDILERDPRRALVLPLH